MIIQHGMAVLLTCCLAGTAIAQAPLAKAANATKTLLQVEVITGPDGGALQAQEWRGVFEQLDVAVTIRRAMLDEKPDVSEKTVGTLRYVTAIGRLDRGGKLVFPEKSFSTSDANKLKEWFKELRTYGKQGAPEGQPLWGLTKPQFEVLYLALSEKNEVELQDLPLDRAVAALKMPDAYPVRWSTAATQRLQSLGKNGTVRQKVAGFSKATALAIALNDRGFGFRPNRTPAGGLELVIEPQARGHADVWPIGWPTQRQVPELLPGLFEMTNIELHQQPLLEVVEAAAELTGTRILYDYAALEQRQINLAALKANYPLKKTTWSIALRAILVPQRLNREYWQDEAGHGFVWITPLTKDRAAPVEKAQ